MKNLIFRQRGFTLIELLVVISIIGILSALLLPNLTSAQARARDGRRKSDLKSIATGLELFYNDNNYYPAPATTGNGKFDFANALVDPSSGTTTYIKSPMPKDPKNAGGYEYYYCTVSTSTPASNKKFNLFAKLENANDPDKCAASGACPGTTRTVCSRGSAGTAYASATVDGYNYTVSEP